MSPAGDTPESESTESDRPESTGSEPDVPSWPPPGSAVGVARVGLIYDRLLGGALHTAADRRAADAMVGAAPVVSAALRHAQAFRQRAIATMLDHGIGQIIDLGAGPPSPFGVCGHLLTGFAQVVVVDADPVVAELHRQNCHPVGHTVVEADIRDTDTVLRAVAHHLDLHEPVGLLATGVLHFLTEEDRPRELVRRYTDPLAVGSLLALTHAAADEDDIHTDARTRARKLFTAATGLPIQPRTPGQLHGLLPDWTLLRPHVVPSAAWRPDQPYDRADTAVRAVSAAVMFKHRRPLRRSSSTATAAAPPLPMQRGAPTRPV